MRDSILNSVSVPAIGSAPALVVQAGEFPMRVMVRNVSGALIFLAHGVQDLNSIGSNAGVYQLPAGARDYFYLAPRQTLVAAAVGGGGELSYAASIWPAGLVES